MTSSFMPGLARRCGLAIAGSGGEASSRNGRSRQARSSSARRLIIPEESRAAIDPTNLGNYIFLWEPGTTGEDLYSGKGRAAIALGYASLVNHSDEPNCRFIRHFEALALDLVALRGIEAGEELTFDYDMTLWFDPA
jgi:SET domain